MTASDDNIYYYVCPIGHVTLSIICYRRSASAMPMCREWVFSHGISGLCKARVRLITDPAEKAALLLAGRL